MNKSLKWWLLYANEMISSILKSNEKSSSGYGNFFPKIFNYNAENIANKSSEITPVLQQY